MTEATSSRELILRRIREALHGQEGETIKIPREYEREGLLDVLGRVALFEARLEEYGASTHRVEASVVGERLAGLIEGAGVSRVAVPAAVSPTWRKARVEWLVDEDATAMEVEMADGVLTASSVAIASTGTIVLQHRSLEGRRLLSLLPDHHFCVVREDQILETLPEAMEWLGQNATVPMTFISGPSATADIEMTRIKGVHGPRHLHVVIVRE